MRRVKKFSEGGKTDRAKSRMDRRMADIEKDFKIALAKGRSEKEARAKRAQREADAKDDFAKRTGGDRTETRAAEKAAEARLKTARRSPDKDVKAVSVASEGPSRKSLVDTSAKVETPKVGASPGKQTFSQAFAAARKDGAKTFTFNGKSYTTEMRGEKKPTASATTSSSRPGGRSRTSGARGPDFMGNMQLLARQAAAEAKTAKESSTSSSSSSTTSESKRTPNDFSARGSAIPFKSFRDRLRAAGEADDRARGVGKAKGGKVQKFAKGGKIDGCAVRGKTKAMRKK